MQRDAEPRVEAAAPGERALIDAALAGDRQAVRSLVDLITPQIRMRVFRVLMRGGAGRDVQTAVEDLSQQVLLALFAQGGRELRAWDPQKPLSLVRFVGLIAERQAIDTVRTRRRNPFTEIPTAADDLELCSGSVDNHEQQAASRALIEGIVEQLRATLTPYAMQMFERLFIDELEVAEIAQEFSMSTAAIYAWRSRLAEQVRECAREILSEQPRRVPPTKARPRHGGR
jgi:RNA polymerase sigma factor (sigma-70 family)